MPLILVPAYKRLVAAIAQAYNPSYDPYFDQVKILLHADGPLSSATYTSVKPVTFTSWNSPTISNARAKFGTTSFYLNADNSNIQTADKSQDYNIGSSEGDFTAEMWYYPTAFYIGGVNTEFFGWYGDLNVNDNWPNAALSLFAWGDQYGNHTFQLLSRVSNVQMDGFTIENPIRAQVNQWHHIALTRQGNTYRFFIDGVLVASTTFNGGTITSEPMQFRLFSGRQFDTYYDEVRYTKGVARYTENFTVPNGPFPSFGLVGDGWKVAWAQNSDSHNQATGWEYGIPLSEVQAATEAIIAFYDSTASSVSLSNAYRFPIPADWKTQHPFNYPTGEQALTAIKQSTGEVFANAILRYGHKTFQGRISDPWIASANWGRIGIANVPDAPFFSSFADPAGDHTAISSETYSASQSWPTRRFIILVK